MPSMPLTFPCYAIVTGLICNIIDPFPIYKNNLLTL
ncbi:hypothetical protein THOG10_330044 [Vibrio rotiferianus]|nr:hypothetical protein THOG10_330044 [Vibrio rotiferianus]